MTDWWLQYWWIVASYFAGIVITMVVLAKHDATYIYRQHRDFGPGWALLWPLTLTIFLVVTARDLVGDFYHWLCEKFR